MSRLCPARHAAAVALVVLGSCGDAPAVEPRRVVLVTIDTLREDTLFGSDQRESAMPRLLAWANEATVFETFLSVSPSTQPTHASLLTGAFPWQHGVTRNGLALAERHRTVAEVLQGEGWATGAVVASYPLTERMGLAQGFGLYLDAIDEHTLVDPAGEEIVQRYSKAARITARARELLDRLEGEPRQFLWVHFFDPHAPYGDAPTGEEEPLMGAAFAARVLGLEDPEERAAELERARRLYDEDAGFLDRELSALLAELERDEVPTHVVVVSDHGESFGGDGSLGHGKRLSPPQLAVPLVVRSPDVEPGRRAEPVSSVDVATTLLALAGSDAELGAGRDLTSSIGPGLVAGQRTTFGREFVDPRLDGDVVVEGSRWFVYSRGAIRAGDAEAVWTNDDESSPAPPEVAAEARRLFEIFEEELVGARPVDDPATRAALEALGYAK